MPGFRAPAARAVLQAHGSDAPRIVVSGSVGEDTAVAAMRAGATDYIMKDRLQRLGPAVARAVADAGVRRERRRLEQQLLRAQKMEAVGRPAARLAHDLNYLLTESIRTGALVRHDGPPAGSL